MNSVSFFANKLRELQECAVEYTQISTYLIQLTSSILLLLLSRKAVVTWQHS